jgi:hypothetical protein
MCFLRITHVLDQNYNFSLQVKNTKQKRGKRENPHRLKPEEHEGMPHHHQHCPLAKRREDRNPKYHEEQQKCVA